MPIKTDWHGNVTYVSLLSLANISDAWILAYSQVEAPTFQKLESFSRWMNHSPMSECLKQHIAFNLIIH